jgi:L-2-hydroxyglutarate oxidase LhgO
VAQTDVEVAIVGAGVVGCAAASLLAARGRSVALLEAGPRIAEGATSRNSGVIHSGLYYPPGSLKARTCVRGNRLLYEWAAAHGVAHAKVGKLVVARDEADVPALEELFANARASGAPGIALVNGAFVRAREPSLQCAAAIWCPETGIVDAVALARSLAHDAVQRGAMLLVNARVLGISGAWDLDTERGPIRAARVINSAGLYADEIAALAGAGRYRIHPCRGDYFRLGGAWYRHLIYPARKRGALGLGVHVTLDLAGRVRLGPDAEHCASKEDFTPREDKLAAFAQAARRLLGDVREDQLAWDGCGIRPKLRAPGESEEKDFVLSEDRPGFVNLIGIESPGLTAALALAELLA